MIKVMPYSQYDVLAIENWLNDIAAQGYRLTEFGAFFCKFKKNEGSRIYYRVRYIEGNRDIGNAFWWGDLYVYHSENPNKLPHPNYDEDARVCASKQGKPHQMILAVLASAYIVQDLVPDFGTYPPALIAACVFSILMWVLELGQELLQWNRANQLAGGSITVSVDPPKPHGKVIGLAAELAAIVSLAIVVVVNLS